MANDVKQRMIEGASRLLATNGLQGTSFSEVLELTGAPRGSVYHHFPKGKNQLVEAAVDLAGQRAIDFLERKAGASAVEVAEYFLALWREVLVRSHFEAGCAVLAVTVAADSPELLDHAASVFRAWRHRLAELLATGGLRADAAPGFAALLVAACEGAVVVSRAEQSLEPFDLVSAQLVHQVRALSA